MTDEKQLQDAVERVVQKLNTERLKELAADGTEQKDGVQPRRGFSDADQAPESETSRVEAVVDAKTSPQPTAEMYSGLVRLLISRPVNHDQIRIFQERLGKVDGFQVKSVGGSSVEGPNIILLVQLPIPLLERLSQLDLVERVSKGKKGLEVTLRPSHS